MHGITIEALTRAFDLLDFCVYRLFMLGSGIFCALLLLGFDLHPIKPRKQKKERSRRKARVLS